MLRLGLALVEHSLKLLGICHGPGIVSINTGFIPVVIIIVSSVPTIMTEMANTMYVAFFIITY